MEQGKTSEGLGEFSRWGFTLEYPDDHVVLLMHEGELVARFSQLGATEESLQEECARHLVTHPLGERAKMREKPRKHERARGLEQPSEKERARRKE